VTDVTVAGTATDDVVATSDVDAEMSAAAETVDDRGTAVTLRSPSCVATSFIASTGSKTRPQPAGSQLGLTTDPLLLLLLLTSADDAVIFAAAADITPVRSHTHTHTAALSIKVFM